VTKAPTGAPASSRSAPKAGSTTQANPARNAKAVAPKPAEQPGHARIIAIANQKGGVGKSTTAVSLGAALADLGFRVLVVDLDPQGNASTGLGIRHDARATTVYDVVVTEAPVEQAVVETGVKGLHAIPSTIDLAGAEIELVSQFSRESRLKKALEPILEGAYDFVLLDCPPSLGLLTVNALTAAEELIVPIQCEYYALEGLGQLLRNVSLVQQNINPGLRLTGIVMTMFDARTKLSEQVVAEVRRFFGDLVYDVIIPRTIRLSEAPGFGQPITVYDPRSKGAETYRDLAREVALRPPPEAPMPSYEDLPILTVTPFGDANQQQPEGLEDPREGARDVLVEPEHQVQKAEPLQPPQSEPLMADPASPDEDEAAAGVTADGDGPSDPRPSRRAPKVTSPRPATPSPPPEDDIWEDEPSDDSGEPIPSPAEAHPDRRIVVIDDDRDIDIRAGQEAVAERPADDPSPQSHDAVTPIGGTLQDDEGGRRRRWRLFRKGGDG
jgi:chromosome partitioning protein